MSTRLESWLGRQETRTDWTAPGALQRLAALLDHELPPWPESELPPLGHWLFHLSTTRQSELGHDGHPRKGGFMPPIDLPRRMWAGSRVSFLRAVPAGAELTRVSTIKDIANKAGGAGKIVIVTIEHQIVCRGQAAVVELQDVAYLPARTGPWRKPPGGTAMNKATAVRRFRATPELLFRFSALTFNAHRIHYDRDYAREEEKYPGLVVQGPLLALLLVDHYLRHTQGRRILELSIRARAPVLDSELFDLCAAPTPSGADLWVAGADGSVRMTAEAVIEE